MTARATARTAKAPFVMAARFAGTCANCNLGFRVGTPILWAPGLKAAHASEAACHDAEITHDYWDELEAEMTADGPGN